MKRRLRNTEGNIRQVNQHDTNGELWASKHIDLRNGKVRVSRKLKRVLKEADDLPFGTFTGRVKALLVFTNQDLDPSVKHYYAITKNHGYRCSLSSDPRILANWGQASSSMSGSFNDETDATVFDGRIIISRSTDIAEFNGLSGYDDDWWTTDVAGVALTANKPHTLLTHRGGEETLVVTDGNLVRYYTVTTGHATIPLAKSLVANTLASGIDKVWVGTYAESSENAYVYEFAVNNDQATNAYPIDAKAVLSMDVLNNTPYILTSTGRIQYFNGVGFVDVPNGQLPFFNQSKGLSGITEQMFNYTSPPVAPKGMRIDGRSILINIAAIGADNLTPVDDRSNSGIWEYNMDTASFHHRYSFSDATTDYGHTEVEESGPLLVLNSDTVTVMAGAGTGVDGLYMDSEEPKQGYFITPEYYGDALLYLWRKTTSIAQLNGGSVAVKYRLTKEDPTYIPTCNWINATSFTTTTALTSDQIGYEMEIIDGYGAGKLATVLDIDGGATKTVVIDTAIGATSQTSEARLQNWTPLAEPHTEGQVRSFGIGDGGESNPKIQFKVILTGDVELYDLVTSADPKEVI